MNDRQGYEFRFARSRLSLGLAAAGALASAGVGTLLILLAAPAGPPRDERLAAIAVGVALLGFAAVVLRRALFQCHDCRIGEAGIYLGGLFGERLFRWKDVVRCEVEGRTIRVLYRRAEGGVGESWVEAPRGAKPELARIAIFTREHVPAAAPAAIAPAS